MIVLLLQVEVDDYGNYEKALGALNEALRCIGKNTEQHSNIVETVTRKIALVNKFIDIKRYWVLNSRKCIWL